MQNLKVSDRNAPNLKTEPVVEFHIFSVCPTNKIPFNTEPNQDTFLVSFSMNAFFLFVFASAVFFQSSDLSPRSLVKIHADNYATFVKFSATVSAKIKRRIDEELESINDGKQLNDDVALVSAYFAQNTVDAEKIAWRYFDKRNGKRSDELIFDGKEWKIYSPSANRIDIVGSKDSGGRFLVDLRQIGSIDSKGDFYAFLDDHEIETFNVSDSTVELIASKSFGKDGEQRVIVVCKSKDGFLPSQISTSWDGKPLQQVDLEYQTIGLRRFPSKLSVTAYDDHAKSFDDQWVQRADYEITLVETESNNERDFVLSATNGTPVRDSIRGRSYRLGKLLPGQRHLVSVIALSIVFFLACIFLNRLKSRTSS